MKNGGLIIKWTLPITLSVTIICFAALFSLYFRGLYYWDIHYLSISKDAHISQEKIKENYDVLIDYLTNEDIEELVLPSFGMSEEGGIHFADVKHIFTVLKKATYILGIYSMIGICFSLIKKRYNFLKHTAIGMIIIPLSILLAAMVNFDKAFVIFHNLAFSNDYWIFDPVKDPVIMILPQEFFLHSFLLIISIILVIALCLISIYGFKNKAKKLRNNNIR